MHRNKNLHLLMVWDVLRKQSIVTLTTVLREYSYSQVHTTHFTVEGNSIFNLVQAGHDKVLSDNPGQVRLKYGSNTSCLISKPHLL